MILAASSWPDVVLAIAGMVFLAFVLWLCAR